MKLPHYALLSIFLTGWSCGQAAEATPLPFPVTVGGQVASYREEEPFAKLAKPVAPDAAVSIETKSEMIVINVAPVDEKGVLVPQLPPAIIILQGTTNGSLADTLDKHPLAPGNYLLSITAESKTATILMKIE